MRGRLLLAGAAAMVAMSACEADRALGAHGARLKRAGAPAPDQVSAAMLPPCATTSPPLDWPRRELPALGIALRLPPTFTRRRSPFDDQADSVRRAIQDSVARQFPDRKATFLVDEHPTVEHWMAPDSAVIMLMVNTMSLAVGVDGTTLASEPSCAIEFQGRRLRADLMRSARSKDASRNGLGAAADSSLGVVILPAPEEGGLLLGGAGFFHTRADRAAFLAALADATLLGPELPR